MASSGPTVGPGSVSSLRFAGYSLRSYSPWKLMALSKASQTRDGNYNQQKRKLLEGYVRPK